jgi:succinoglycan biosynthesis transport protein ExoP
MLMELQKNWSPNASPHASTSDASGGILSVSGLLALVRRQIKLIAVCILATVLLGLVAIVTTKPMYEATAALYMDIQNAQLAEGGNNATSVAPLGLGEANVNSQLVIIKSEKIAIKVIKDMKLADLPEFNRPQSMIVGLIGSTMNALRGILSFGQSAPALPQTDLPRGVIEAFAKRLKVDRVDETFVLSISFSSEDRQRAADIANAVAAAYLDEKLDARYDSVKRASSWLEGRLAELRQQAVASDQLVQSYKRENGIVDTNSGNGQLLSDTQLTDLSTRLSEARKDTAQKQARYDQIQQMISTDNPDASVVDSLASAVINELRQQYSKVSQQESDISRRYGADHEAAKKLQRQMQDINGLIVQELGRIAQVYRSDLDVAKQQEADLARTVDQFTARSGDIAQARVKLRELERDAQADQNLYESFLDRYKSALQQQSFPITDARVLTAASAPRDKSSPKTVLTLILGAVAGLAIGMTLAIGRELMDSSFRSPGQLEQVLNLACLGVLPKLTPEQIKREAAKRKQVGPPRGTSVARPLSANIGAYRHAVDAPLSRFSETLRSAKLAIDLSKPDRGVRVIGIVSSVPGEGKSTVSMNLGHLIADAGHSVLVIDADLRSPSLSRDVAPEAQAGLFECLTKGLPVAELLFSDESGKLRFLPAAGRDRTSHTSELMGSSSMARLLAQARQSFDYVIVDLPPLAPVVDSRAVAGAIDGFVYVIEWGATSVATVTDTLHGAPPVSQKIVGCLLNKADMSALRLYAKSEGNSDYYSYDKFSSYLTRD